MKNIARIVSFLLVKKNVAAKTGGQNPAGTSNIDSYGDRLTCYQGGMGWRSNNRRFQQPA